LLKHETEEELLYSLSFWK